MLTVPAKVTIDEAFDAFLVDQRKRLSPKTLRNYEDVVHLLRDSLNCYAYDSLGKSEQKRWRTAFDAGDEEAYCHLFSPEKIVDHLGEFLGWFMVRKVMAGEDLLRASGTVTKKLAAWLHEQGHITDEQREAATGRGAEAARDLPNADRLGSLLHDEMQKTPRFDVDDIPEEHWIEDFLAIERVEPGKLWFEDELAHAFVAAEALAAAPRLAGLADDEFEVLWDELLELPGRDLSLHFPLPKLVAPELHRLIEAIGDDDADAADEALEDALDRLDTPVARAVLARAVIALRDTGRLRPPLAALAIVDLAGRSRALVRASLVEAAAVALGAARTPGRLVVISGLAA